MSGHFVGPGSSALGVVGSLASFFRQPVGFSGRLGGNLAGSTRCCLGEILGFSQRLIGFFDGGFGSLFGLLRLGPSFPGTFLGLPADPLDHLPGFVLGVRLLLLDELRAAISDVANALLLFPLGISDQGGRLPLDAFNPRRHPSLCLSSRLGHPLR